ncbi:MAG: hypothetical protein WBG90_14615 [Saonia sp.]
MDKTKILIIIPARGGSKGIPRKNLRTLNGKPLISYSISNALKISSCEVDCYVSSNDNEILLIASKFGAKTITRDESISGDTTTLDPVIYDAYKKIKKKENKEYDLVITLQPTSPLLSRETIETAIGRLIKNNLDTVISGVYDSHLTWIKLGNDYIPNYEKRVNRQELPQIYKETGGFVITRTSFITKNSRFGKRIEVFPLSKKEAIDIDDFDDWNLCEYYLKRKTILFVVSGNSRIGMGHVYNTLSIANEILDHRIVFLVDSTSKLAYDKITESNYEVYIQDQPSIIQGIELIRPNVVINDILDTTEEYILELRQRAYRIINFEDIGQGSKHADLVINAMYPEHKLILNHYYGHEYFILRDEFLYTPEKVIKKDVKSILISFGGVDPNNFTRRILTLLEGFCTKHSIAIKVITGMGYKYSEELMRDFPKIKVKNNISNISEEILNADIVFTSAGRTTFEVASIGVPCIVLCQNLRETTHFFASEKNGFYNLGLGEDVLDDSILEAFKETLNFNLRKLMNSRMLRNGLKKGKSNVLKLIKKTI